MTEPTHYQVLALPKSLLDDATTDQIPIILKQAYHRALLRHHPDKTGATQPTPNNTSTPTYTVDQITLAHSTLLSSTLRSEYNAQLRISAASKTAHQSSTFQTGIETIDLDDLEYTEESGSVSETRWFRPCRCGNEQGFAFGEADLEEAGDLGELLVGCLDCSLWLRVCFAVVEEEEEGVGDDGDHGKEGQETMTDSVTGPVGEDGSGSV